MAATPATTELNVKFTGADANAIQAFENVTARQVQNGLVQLADWADHLRTTALASSAVPLTSEHLSDVADLKQIYDQAMAAALPASGSNGQPAFSTAQQLLKLLPTAITGIQYDSTSNELSFQVNAAATLPPVTAPLSLNTQSTPASIFSLSSSTSVTITPSTSLGFTFGVDLQKLGTEGPSPVALSPTTTFSQLNGGQGVNLGVVAITADNLFASDYGQLVADTTFALTVNGGQPVSVSLKQSDTANNASLNDLINQLNSALSATTLGATVTATNDNGRIAFVASSSTGVVSLSIADAANLGFSDGQTSDADVLITLRDGVTFPISFKGLIGSSTLSDVKATIENAAKEHDSSVSAR